MSTIKEGIISENELLDLFATQKQKDRYESSGNKFVSSNKQTVLKQARKYCDIRDIGNRSYEISKVHEYPTPVNFDKMNKGIHQYITPLVLTNLINSKICEEKNVTFTCTKWHNMIGLINDNYIHMRYNIDYHSNKLSLKKDVLYDFFNTTEDVLDYYFKKSLGYLKTAGLIDYQKVNWVCVRKITESISEDGRQKIQIDHVHRKAEQFEIESINECEEIACKFAEIDINNDIEKFYGGKSSVYLNKFKELLLKQNILFQYKAYELHSINNDIRQYYELLNKFDINNKADLILKLNTLFQKNLIDNAKKRILEKPEKRNLFTKADINSFLKDYKKIVKLTLSCDDSIEIANTLGASKKEDIDNIINNNLLLSINGKTMNIGIEEYKQLIN